MYLLYLLNLRSIVFSEAGRHHLRSALVLLREFRCLLLMRHIQLKADQLVRDQVTTLFSPPLLSKPTVLFSAFCVAAPNSYFCYCLLSVPLWLLHVPLHISHISAMDCRSLYESAFIIEIFFEPPHIRLLLLARFLHCRAKQLHLTSSCSEYFWLFLNVIGIPLCTCSASWPSVFCSWPELRVYISLFSQSHQHTWHTH